MQLQGVSIACKKDALGRLWLPHGCTRYPFASLSTAPRKGRRRGGRRARQIGAVWQHGAGKDEGSGGHNAPSSSQNAEGAEAAEFGADPQVASSEERMHAWKELMGDRHYLRSQAGFSGRRLGGSHQQTVALTEPLLQHRQGVLGVSGRDWRLMVVGAVLALLANVFLAWSSHLPLWQRVVHRFIWWGRRKPSPGPYGVYTGEADDKTTAMVLYSDTSETVEWINMCWRKAWRVYQRGLEKWLADLLQPVFDNLVAEGAVPSFVQRLRILEFTLDHEAPYFSNMRRRQSRKDSDLNGVVDVRYTGGARMLLLLVVGQGRWRFKIPVLVSDLDLESRMWIKVRLAPMCPFLGTISLAFVGPPTIKVQLLPYNRVRLMRIPILQAFLTKLLTIDLPGLMVLPKRLEINIPPAVTAVAEAAVGREAVMRAVASAVLQADALENALMAALPLGPQSAAGGVCLPTHFNGELSVTLLEGRNLPVWGFPWQSNPYCRLTLGNQAVRGRKEDQTSHAGSHRNPVWNQEFQFLVEDPKTQALTISIRDSHITGRPDVGYVRLALSQMPADGKMEAWLPVQSPFPGQGPQGELHLQLVYKPFEDDEEEDDAYSEADYYARTVDQPSITDVKSAADASSRAAVAASAAAAAVAVTKAAAARAAAKAARRQMAQRVEARRQALEAQEAASSSPLSSSGVGSVGGNGKAPAHAGEGATPSDVEGNGLAVGDANGSHDIGVNGTGPYADESPVRRSIADSEDFDPEDLFPGWEFRVSDKYDEDMPYPFQKGRRRPRSSASKSGASQDKAESQQEEEASQRSGDPQQAVEEGGGGGRSVEEERQALTRAWALEAAQEGEVVVPRGDAEDHPPPYDTHHLPGGSANALTKQVGLHSIPGPHKRAPEEREQYYGHADESIADIVKADAAASELSPRDPADEGWWAGTKNTVKGAVGGAVTGVVTWWDGVATWWKQDTGDDPLETKRKKDAERRERDRREGREPLEDVMVPPDLPIEAIAEEVKDAWRLKEVHVESLMKKAVEKSERPWLMFLGASTIVCIIMLALVFWRLESLL